jgi:hypothetical protein
MAPPRSPVALPAASFARLLASARSGGSLEPAARLLDPPGRGNDRPGAARNPAATEDPAVRMARTAIRPESCVRKKKTKKCCEGLGLPAAAGGIHHQPGRRGSETLAVLDTADGRLVAVAKDPGAVGVRLQQAQPGRVPWCCRFPCGGGLRAHDGAVPPGA